MQYAWQGLTVGLNWEFLSSIADQSASMNPATKVKGVPAYNLLGLTSSYNFGKVTVRFGIDNLMDKEPLIVGANPGFTTASSTTNPGLYDPLGRRYYIGVKASL